MARRFGAAALRRRAAAQLGEGNLEVDGGPKVMLPSRSLALALLAKSFASSPLGSDRLDVCCGRPRSLDVPVQRLPTLSQDAAASAQYPAQTAGNFRPYDGDNGSLSQPGSDADVKRADF